MLVSLTLRCGTLDFESLKVVMEGSIIFLGFRSSVDRNPDLVIPSALGAEGRARLWDAEGQCQPMAVPSSL